MKALLQFLIHRKTYVFEILDLCNNRKYDNCGQILKAFAVAEQRNDRPLVTFPNIL